MSNQDTDHQAAAKLFGEGIVVFVTQRAAEMFAQRRPSYPIGTNAYVHIDKDGHITVFSGKVELGQGVKTSLAQMAAEELGAPLESIEMCLGTTDRCPWDMGTVGSLSIRLFGPILRAAAVEARTVLIGLAAEELQVTEDMLALSDGTVYVKTDPRQKVSFGTLAQGRTISRSVDVRAVLGAFNEHTIMGGESPPRLDSYEKVTGSARFAGDIRLPGMLTAKIIRPPAHGATLARVDASAAAEIDGVRVVNEDGLVAALHPDPEVAEKARAAIRAAWTQAPPGADHEGVFEELLAKEPTGEIADSKGDVAASIAASAKIFEHTYYKGYTAHAPIETHSATAQFKDGQLTVWPSTQAPFPTRDLVAQLLGLARDKVRVITPYVGGAFGGKTDCLHAAEAAMLAKITGSPVQVVWTRAEEFFYDAFDPAAVVKISSALDEKGKIILWDYNVYFAGNRGSELLYDVANARISVWGSRAAGGSDFHRFNVGPWRAPGANMNVWARESTIDVLAAAAGADPLEFRLNNISDQRMINVLKAAAKQFGWTPAARPSGRGVGVACALDAGTCVVLMAEVEVNKKQGTVKVERVVAAQEMGVVINPEGARMQMEGCVTMGLGYALTEELHFDGGRILDESFTTYELPRFSWLPKIETVLVKNDQVAPQGGGEPPIVPMGGVIANAVFDATGVRLNRLPITPQRLQAALALAEEEE